MEIQQPDDFFFLPFLNAVLAIATTMFLNGDGLSSFVTSSSLHFFSLCGSRWKEPVTLFRTCSRNTRGVMWKIKNPFSEPLVGINCLVRAGKMLMSDGTLLSVCHSEHPKEIKCVLLTTLSVSASRRRPFHPPVGR